eukprot:TRINITY_DN11106_c0_g1_i2.p1 TRINITY_DN11106_c0_g1~~TRINITY_DN11106_c0_g1_i2.p1  ORF type:complete len:294 (+),score=63.41 TRINITY_DN11106_c0_g1_i2:84-884(+)
MIRGVALIIAVASVLLGVPSTRRAESSTQTTGKQLLRKLILKKAAQFLSPQDQGAPSETASELTKTVSNQSDERVRKLSDDDLRRLTREHVGDVRGRISAHYESEDSKPITLEQFKIMVESFPDIETHVEEVFHQLDADGNGVISREEWFEWLGKRLQPVFVQLFVQVASEHDGERKIDTMGLMMVIEEFIDDVDDKELKEQEAEIKKAAVEMLDEFDEDDDDMLSEDEFAEFSMQDLLPLFGELLLEEAETGERAPPQSEVKAKC